VVVAPKVTRDPGNNGYCHQLCVRKVLQPENVGGDYGQGRQTPPHIEEWGGKQ